MPTFDAVKGEYTALWAGLFIRPEHMSEARAMAQRIISHRSRYDDVSKATGVPWYVIGIIHAMECGLNFGQHLHNGDPLARRTFQVPKGRPTTHEGPFTWEESAIDALSYDGLDKVHDWSVERIAYCLEVFNGWGYRNKGIHSPYLWSYTNCYTCGKYVRDGLWSSVAVSQQCGGMALLKCLIELDPTQVDLGHARAAPQAWPKAAIIASAEASAPVEAVKSKSVWALVTGGGAVAADKVRTTWDALPDITADVQSQLGPLESLAGLMRANISAILGTVTLVCIAVAIYRHAHDKKTIRELRGE